MSRFSIGVGAAMISAWTSSVFGQNIPAGYSVPDITLSPDGRYGVTVQNNADWLAAQNLPNPKQPKNEIIEVKTGHSLGVIQMDPDNAYFEGMNHADLVPTLWSADDSMLLWQVDGKWGFATEILIKLDNGKIKSQIDVLKLLQKEMLKRTREASPDKYAAVKAGSGGYGGWYQDGFAIDCVLDSQTGPMKFPLSYHIFLTSNTKGLQGMTNVDSRMTAEMKLDGTIKVDEFHLGTDPPSRNWD